MNGPCRTGWTLGLVWLLGGCATTASNEAKPRSIDLAAFAGATRAEDEDGAAADPGPPVTLAAAAEDAEWESLDVDGIDDRDADRSVSNPRLESGDRVIIDGMVGQVNGRPIFADAFFTPIEDKLIALRRQADRPEEYGALAAPVVMTELQAVVLNALFLAEAESDLTVEEQQGIRYWLKQLESQVISGYEGSEEKARRAIYEEEGKSFEAHLEGLRDQALIQRLLAERIAPRIIVSWTDVEREYLRRIDEFQPPASITIARIRLATRDTAAIEDVERRLAEGEDFVLVAESLGSLRGSVWQTFEVENGDLANVEIANDMIREQLAPLRSVGDVAGPFEIAAYTWWLAIAEIDQPPLRDLYDYDLQRELAAEIRQARGSEEQDRYIRSLMDTGIYDELEGMGQRLLLIALHRYGP